MHEKLSLMHEIDVLHVSLQASESPIIRKSWQT